ncbi:MAPEG family protein [Arenibacterium sp. LLYu02]|uniref:MAPEG family protein n=1 Tax=Arenibacterium sp. LLYu02 TaxID=3404132 RepID=UPI003B227748
MTTELMCLLAIAMLLLALAAVSGTLYGAQTGPAMLLGNREKALPAIGAAGRAARAHLNLLENAVPFAIVVLIAHQLALSTDLSRGAAVVFVIARLVHATAYLLGIPYIRTLAWSVGMGATCAMAALIAV